MSKGLNAKKGSKKEPKKTLKEKKAAKKEKKNAKKWLGTRNQKFY